MNKIKLEEVINKWFEMKYQTYDKLDNEDSIYLYYKGERFAEIRIVKKSKVIFYEQKFHNEFSQIIHIQKNEFQEFMIKWVETTFNLRGFTPEVRGYFGRRVLEIPK